MKIWPTRTTTIATVFALLVAGLAGGAAAWAHRGDDDDHERHERGEHDGYRESRDRGDRRAVAALPAYREECGGSCHVAYPPGLLPAESWKRLMSGLDSHYGSDASLDAATAKTISAWLDSHAGTGRRARSAPPEDRITKSAWFEREHDEIRAAVWQRKSVGSPANCAACHPRAEQGDFEEHDVRIPK